MTAPAFGSLRPPYQLAAFSFALPTIIFLGSLYAVRLHYCYLFLVFFFSDYPIKSVSARMIFFRLFKNSRHLHSNTVTGWSAWVGILAASWAVAFVIAEVIPFFSDMLSLMCTLFGMFIR
jgi:hypothetical protein